MRISAIRQPVSRWQPESKNSSAQLNDRTEKPADFSKRCIASRYDSSSSTSATILGTLSLAIQIQNQFDHREMQLWLVIRALIGIYKVIFNCAGGSFACRSMVRSLSEA